MTMNPQELPAQVYEAFCPHCGCRIEYAEFVAEFSNFGRYLEVSTGTLVRFDLDDVHYQKLEIAGLLSATALSLGINSGTSRWIDQSTELFCPGCQTVVLMTEARDNRFCFVGKVVAYCVPPIE